MSSASFAGCNYGSSSMSNRFNENPYDDIEFTDVAASKDVSHTSSVRNNSKEFTWLGPAWLCEKRWKHYRSFCRKGITISVCYPLIIFLYFVLSPCVPLRFYQRNEDNMLR
jgi:hypothetical protein